MNSNQTQKSSGSKDSDKKASSVLTISVIVGVLFILVVAVSSYYGLVRF